jgi:hypothetical protein
MATMGGEGATYGTSMGKGLGLKLRECILVCLSFCSLDPRRSLYLEE